MSWVEPIDGAGNSASCFYHSALFYAGEDRFLAGTLPFIRAAVAAGEPILVAVANARIELLREVLGSEADKVNFADMHVLGSNPARIIPAWHRFLDEQTPDERPVRGIGEPIWAARSNAELTECQRHESLLNVAFENGRAWQLLCPYDLEALDETIIDEARRSHPFVAEDGNRGEPSDAYVCHAEGPGPFHGQLPQPSTQPRELAFTTDGLASVRRFVSLGAADASLERARADDLVLAVNELAANSLRHGGGTGTLRMWKEVGILMCEVRDSGHIEEPLAGRTPPTPTQSTGRGLWIVHQLCDLVQIRSTPAGSIVRVHMRLT
jgi:anti-sigma regulatory factor (Ser/Thr protein kinase)